ncbi:hypothetical protein GCM10023094_41560 [Rhodococcus olei]|uniref:Uncharacterized protein n=1 Tax=Rhodococcus olei TaxID=2161675 RepID=A0ABP8PDN6_9NOCA
MAEIEIAIASTHGEALAWSAAPHTVTDAYGHLTGRRFNGAEAVIGACAAVHLSCSAQWAVTFATDLWLHGTH